MSMSQANQGLAVEIEVAGNAYRIGRLDAFRQFHLSRKIAPLMPKLLPAFMELSKKPDLLGDMQSIADAMAPFADALAEMTDEAAEYVVATCLSVVHRRQGNSWAPVWNSQVKATMFDDMDMSTMVPIVVRVITENLGPFLQGLLTGRKPAEQAAAE